MHDCRRQLRTSFNALGSPLVVPPYSNPGLFPETDNMRRRAPAGWLNAVIVLSLILGGATSSFARQQPNVSVLTPHRVSELRVVTGAEMSPDGTQVAYTLSVPRKPNKDEDGDPWAELWVVASSGGQPRPFITGKVNVSAVRWTADSRQLAFLAKRGDDKLKSLYLIPVDGGEARKAVELKADIAAFSLAPDGKRVALVAREPEDKDSKKLKEKGFTQEVYEEDWRPARLWIATLFATEEKVKPLELKGHVHQVHWSPVDDRLLVSMAPTPSVDDSYVRQQVRIVEAASGKIVTRIDNPGKLGSVAWSPDGKRVGLIAAGDAHDPSPGRLLVADASSGTFRDVLPGFLGQVSQFAWVGNETLAYVAAVGVETVFATLDVSTAAAPAATILGAGGPIFSRLSVANDGQHVALVASTATHPAELFTWSAGATAPERRTDSNPSLANLRLARQEVVRHKARDGLELEGVLIRPLDEVAGKRYPLIVDVHGGPEAHVSNGWLTNYGSPGQVAAARGFAAFYPNYRGSTGRGVAFSKLGQGDPGGKEFDDLVDAVDHLIAAGLVDRDKVGITGGSYGGYATAWASTRYSERFAAGVMFVGISDNVSKVGTTDIPNEEYLVHSLKRPWDNWQFLLERSPIYHAGNSRTPLLIMHGKDDPRVNVGQSLELHRHLKMHDQAPVRLVLYPAEQHGNSKAAARLDYNLRLLQWMQHYLQGPGGEPPPLDLDYTDPDAPKKTEAAEDDDAKAKD
jgi:dipeptidyl aminopeptidase/acylaminoacyl peptidase